MAALSPCSDAAAAAAAEPPLSVMDAVADPDLNERKRAPSQQPHPAWRLELQVEFNDVSMRLARIEANAKRFLAQGSNGGTQAELRLIVGFIRTPLLLTTRAPFDGGGSSSCSSATNSASCNLIMVVIFDGKGRYKNSVSRSLQSFDQVQVHHKGEVDNTETSWWQNSLKLLRAVPIRDVLSLALGCPAQNMMAQWQGNNNLGYSVISYLTSRIALESAESADAATSAQHRIQNMCSGLDTLGPGSSRKRAAEALLCGPAAPPLRLMGPTTTAPAMPSSNPALQANRLLEGLPPSEEAYRLRELLTWSDGLSCEQAAEKAAKLVELLRELLEENWTHKIAAAARRAQDENNVCLLPHAASFPSIPPE